MAGLAKDLCASENNKEAENESGLCPAGCTLDRSHTCNDLMDKLLLNNAIWSETQIAEDPLFFERLCNQQHPQFFWIGCSDSRVSANQILGLMPGEVFVQRNVGNQALHTDMNCMSCLEYAVKELKVRCVIVCGHYGCGAVKAALRLASNTQSMVNGWISDIREVRNANQAELRPLSAEEQVNRLCELNVIEQTFHIATSSVVQWAWSEGQALAIFGMIYSLKDGRLRKLVGPVSADDLATYQAESVESSPRVSVEDKVPELSMKEGEEPSPRKIPRTEIPSFISRVAEHASWSDVRLMNKRKKRSNA